MSECNGCKAEIQWIKTPEGRNHPVDVPPVQIWIEQSDGSWKLQPGFTSHFATCPKADEFRKKT